MSNNNNDNNYITRKNYLNQKAHVVTKCDPGTTATWMTHFSGCPKTNKATEFMRHWSATLPLLGCAIKGLFCC